MPSQNYLRGLGSRKQALMNDPHWRSQIENDMPFEQLVEFDVHIFHQLHNNSRINRAPSPPCSPKLQVSRSDMISGQDLAQMPSSA